MKPLLAEVLLSAHEGPGGEKPADFGVLRLGGVWFAVENDEVFDSTNTVS
jgi:hypothetical protein